MKYCPICLREYSDLDTRCSKDDCRLTPHQARSVNECELCGSRVEIGEQSCRNCGARVNVQGWTTESSDSSSKSASKEETAGTQWFAPGDDDKLPEQEELFRFSDWRPPLSRGKRTGAILAMAGSAVVVAFSLAVVRETHDVSKPFAITPFAQQAKPAPRVENVSPPELPTSQSSPLPDKSIENFTDESTQTDVSPSKKDTSPSQEPVASEPERPLTTKGSKVKADRQSQDKLRASAKSATVSLKSPEGVRIPSRAELRRKKAQHEMEQAMQNRAIPGEVAIPSPIDLRRKKVEHEIEQAIQNRAIEGVTVSFIGNTVFLRGQVETERQKAAAEQAARAVPQAGNIRSSISVRGMSG